MKRQASKGRSAVLFLVVLLGLLLLDERR